MKTMLYALGMASLLAGATAGAAEADRPTRPDALRTLAGTAPVEKSQPPDRLFPEKDQPLIKRDFVQQPPLIPHSIRNYQITRNFNQCMDCHAWSRYRETGAVKVSITHFKDRAGDELSNISPRRYFCTQCHVPQSDAQPLVTNTFRAGEGLR